MAKIDFWIDMFLCFIFCFSFLPFFCSPPYVLFTRSTRKGFNPRSILINLTPLTPSTPCSVHPSLTPLFILFFLFPVSSTFRTSSLLFVSFSVTRRPRNKCRPHLLLPHAAQTQSRTEVKCSRALDLIMTCSIFVPCFPCIS